MRPVLRGSHPENPPGTNIVFKEYRDARPFLEDRTGDYCHFCEKRITNSLAVEHIVQKGLVSARTNDWENFLLICTNCNSCKPKNTLPTEPIADHYFWPHLHNTLLVFDYDVSTTSCGPKPHPDLLNPVDTLRAKNLIDFYKIDLELHPKSGLADGRHRYRMEALRFAKDSLGEYPTKIDIPAILRLATSTGFFSIWLKVFDAVPEVRQALIDCPAFKLQGKGFFDAQYQAIPRNAHDF